MKKEVKYDINSSIPSEEFALAHNEENIHDTKFETRPVSWIEDSFRRFTKSPASVVGFILIAIFVLFSIIVPIVSPYNWVSKTIYPNGFLDVNYKSCLPKLFDNAGGFWDGTETITMGENRFKLKSFYDSNKPYILNPDVEPVVTNHFGIISATYKTRVDTYASGVKTKALEKEDFEKILKYEIENNISFNEENKHKSIIKPLVDYVTYIDNELTSLFISESVKVETISRITDQLKIFYSQNPDVYYKLIPTQTRGGYSDTQFEPWIKEGETEPQEIYLKDTNGNYVYYPSEGTTVRLDYDTYFKYVNGFEVKYVFGSNNEGKDLFTRLAEGGRFSLLLGFGITLINFIIGLIWGSISGYYGGIADLMMERFTDIISNVPTIIIMTIASIQLSNNIELKAKVGPAGVIVLALLVAFVYNGWVGVAGTTRMQFYRFKGQEYVLASRTLGAKDRRLIFKHILPNAAGTLVTRCVLMIPSIIFSESSLSYLGIIDFRSSGIVSIGALLDEGKQAGISTSPHLLLFPAIIVSVLMISFNLFGNGLRDAFNTTLRGSED